MRKPQATDSLTVFGQKFLEIYITNFTYYWRGKEHSLQYLVMDNQLIKSAAYRFFNEKWANAVNLLAIDFFIGEPLPENARIVDIELLYGGATYTIKDLFENYLIDGNTTINLFRGYEQENTFGMYYAAQFTNCNAIAVTLEDDTTIDIVYMGETIKYTGGMSATSEWSDKEQEKVDSNPSTIGEAIKQTYAKVDKVNKQIDMVVGETTANSEALAALQLNTESINASVTKIQEDTAAALEGVNDEVAEIKTQVEANITSEDVTIAIKSEMANGVDKVTTATGFTFNEQGLKVSKDGSDISTQITEDGMRVFKNEEEMLVANNEGVKAKNLHATTYLIIGYNTRFEDYNNNTRTGCFWIGD